MQSNKWTIADGQLQCSDRSQNGMHHFPFSLHLSNRLTHEEDHCRFEKWILTTSFEVLFFADYINILSSCQHDIQEHTNQLTLCASQIGLKVIVDKTKLYKMNTTSNQPVLIFSWQVEEVDECTYQGSKVTINGDGK